MDYLIVRPEKEIDMVASAKIKKLHDMYSDFISVIVHFKGTFSLQFKEDTKPYWEPPRCVANVLQEPFKKELDCKNNK